MRRALHAKKKTYKPVAWLLVAAMLCGLFPRVAVPVLSADQQTAYVVMEEQTITETVLDEGAKLRFEAPAYNASAYQWQIADPQTPDRWVDIAGEYMQRLWVTYALVGSMQSEDGIVQLRCRMQTPQEETYTHPVKVTVSRRVEDDKTQLRPIYKPTNTTPQRLRAAAKQQPTTYSIVINYLFDDNTIAFEPYGATVAANSDFDLTVKSPSIVGYEPFRRVGEEYIAAQYVEFNLTNIQQNVTINVIYEPALVDFSVHHHLQNVLDDEYSIDYDLVTKSQALTGTVVGDGLALSEQQLPGFKSLAYERLPVAADGSTVIEIRYDRNYYLVDFDMNGGYGTEPVYTRYGAAVGANVPTRHGYVFDGWDLVSYNGEEPTREQQAHYALGVGGTITVPDANLRYKARWISQETTYTMVFWCENAEDNGYTYWGYLDDLPAMSGSFVDGQDYVSRVAGIDNEQYFTFNKNKTDKHVLVEGDGSTVVNVYYTRNYYRLTIKATGECSITADHKHTDACYDFVCGLGHTHTADCVSELVCTAPEHKAHTDACITCGQTEHIHGTAGCTCTKQAHTHTVDCWKNIGNVQSSLNGAPKNPENGYIYRSGYYYYIYINGVWYRYTSWGVSNKDVVKPSCGKEEHTHGENCNCSEQEHEHIDSCYRDTLHTHNETCYKYSCGTIEHTHDDACKRLHCPIVEGHSHTTNCNSSSRTNTVKTVYKKYRASLKNIWPITDDNGVTYNSGQRWSPSETDLYEYVLVYIDEMPGDDFTLTVNTSTNSTYTMNYYLQVLPGDDVDVTYSGNNYEQYTQIKANYGRVTKLEDFFDIPGYYQFASNPAFSGDSITINSGSKVVNFYYNRITDHVITFNNNGIVLDEHTVSGVMYGEKVAQYNFTPPYPDNLEPNAYTFGGWYTSPGCFAGTEVDWDTLTMPEGDLLLYAKWEPVVHTVRVFKDKSKTQQIGEDQLVNHGAFAYAPSGNITNGNNVFLGWFYEDVVNGKVVEKAFVFNGIPVLDDMDIYARWGSHVSVNYTIRYKLKETGEEIADPTVGSAIAGHNKTFEAKTEDKLYAGYREGFYPETSSHSITMSADGDHEFTFYYVYVESMPYKVRYVYADDPTRTVFDDKVVDDNALSVVTETFQRKEKMMPDAYQKRLVLSADPTDEDGDGIYDANVITFYYEADEERAYYRVVHYIENIAGEEYREYRFEEAVGIIGSEYTVNALTLTGFAYNPAKTTLNGEVLADAGESVTAKLSGDGMLIEFYYDRQLYEYIVRYVDSHTHEDLCPPKEAQAAFGETVIEYAPDFEPYGYELVSENAKTLTVSANAEMNVLEFLYQEKTVSLKYQIVGPAGCGSLTQYSENVMSITGVPNGSTPIVNNGFQFVGWYLDEGCTVTVDDTWVNEKNHLVSEKTGEVWKTVTYYAKFIALETDLTITTASTADIDKDQVFIFRILGKAGTETAQIDLTVTVVGNDFVTVTKLPVGMYTVTELTDWSWRYENGNASRDVHLTYNGGSNQMLFDNSRENGKWLDGNAVTDNTFR